MSVRLQFDWVDAVRSPDALARCTMAKLRIQAAGADIISVVDRRDRSDRDRRRDHVVVPLHHVAEWLAVNWHHLFHEIEDTEESRPGFETRHDLAFAGDGFVLPHLVISPASGGMNLRWSPSKPRFVNLEFAGSGQARVPAEDLEHEFRALIEAVIDKLHGENLELPALAEAWGAVDALDPEEREFVRAAALLGVDPFDVGDAVADAIVGFWQETPPNLREDALAGARPDSLSQVGTWLRSGLEIVEAVAAGSGIDWNGLRRSRPVLRPGPAWAQGYELARWTHAELGAGDRHTGLALEVLSAIPRHEMPSPSATLQGLVASNTPACVTPPREESGARFLRARALGSFLARPEPAASILSSLATDAQACSRAFAAELLAPAKSLRERLNEGLATPDKVDALAGEFGVAPLVIRHQIENHALASFVDP